MVKYAVSNKNEVLSVLMHQGTSTNGVRPGFSMNVSSRKSVARHTNHVVIWKYAKTLDQYFATRGGAFTILRGAAS